MGIRQGRKLVSVLRNFTIATFSVAIFFVLAEGILRLVHFEYGRGKETFNITASKEIIERLLGPGAIPSTILGYELKPGFKGVMWNTWIEVNTRGFRDREIPVEKAKGNVRIICLGDSSTFGIKIKARDTYPKRLEYMLNSEGAGHYEVMNTGCAGYTSFVARKMLEEKGLMDYSPDIVTLYSGFLDAYEWHGLSDNDSYKLRMLNKKLSKIKVYALLRKIIVTPMLLRYNLTEKIGKLRVRASPEELAGNLKAINSLLKKNKAHLILMTYPIEAETFPEDQHLSLDRLRRYNDIIRRVSRQEDIILLDLEKIFKEKHANATALFLDYCHPSYYGHTVIAEEIYRTIRENGLVQINPDPPSPDYADVDNYNFFSNLDKATVNPSTEVMPRQDGWMIDGDFRYCIFQYPPSVLKYSLQITENWDRLKFGIAMTPDVWDVQKGDGVQFDIAIDDGSGFENIFSQYIDPKNRLEDRNWHDFGIDLVKYRGKKITVAFKTSQGPAGRGGWDCAIWSEPVIR